MISQGTPQPTDTVRLAVISAGVSDPSSTRLLADRLARRSMEELAAAGIATQFTIIDLARLAPDVSRVITGGLRSPELTAAIDSIAAADGIIVATPVYKAGISGLFKSFIDVLDDDLFIAKPVVLAATAGTPRHAMVVDEQMRPLFAFLRAIPAPTSIFAATEDWASTALGERIDRVAAELTTLLRSGVGRAIAEDGWRGYQHQFGGAATRAERTVADVDFGTDLMRLAAGGG